MRNKKYIDGVTLYNGDCFDVMESIKSQSVNLVFCDLPYKKTALKWDREIIPFEPLWEQLLRIGVPSCNFVFTGSQPFTSAIVQSNPKMFKYEWIWEKEQPTSPALAKKQMMRIHENILVFYAKQGTYNPQMTDGKPYKGFSSNEKGVGEVYGTNLKSFHRENFGTRYPKSIQRFAREDRRKNLHPTRKSLGLMRYIIRTFSNPGDMVLDPTMGSGTTLEACVLEKRLGIGIERDKKYFTTAIKQIENLGGFENE